MTASIVALIPARGGSLGLPRKNIRTVGGVPLVVRAITAARMSTSIARVVVSTEDVEIARLSTAASAEIVDRPAELATGAATSADMAVDAVARLGLHDADVLVLLQPTSPLRTSEHIDACVTSFVEHPTARSAISVVAPRHHPYKCLLREDGLLRPGLDTYAFEAHRQLLPDVVEPNGALFVIGVAELRGRRSFYAPPCLAFEMDALSSLDVDTADDLALVEAALARGIVRGG